MKIQVKAGSNAAIVVVAPNGDMWPVVDGDDAWNTLVELWTSQRQISETRKVPGAVTLTIKEHKGLLMLVDEDAEIHSCENEDDLWAVLQEQATKTPVAPQRRTFAPRTVPNERLPAVRQTQERVTDVQVISNEQAEREVHHEPYEDQPTDPGVLHRLIAAEVGEGAADFAVSLTKKLIPTLQKASHRGPPPKPGSRRPKRRVKRGDIV